jgi:hypothetical protein
MCMMLAPLGDGVLPVGTQAPYKSVRLADDGGTTQPTTPTWEPMVGDHYFQPYSTWWGGDNILGNALAAWNVQNNGAGSTSVTPQIDETKPFARRMSTGTTSTGRVAMNVKATTTLLFSSTSHQRTYRFAFRVPTLSATRPRPSSSEAASSTA